MTEYTVKVENSCVTVEATTGGEGKAGWLKLRVRGVYGAKVGHDPDGVPYMLIEGAAEIDGVREAMNAAVLPTATVG